MKCDNILHRLRHLLQEGKKGRVNNEKLQRDHEYLQGPSMKWWEVESSTDEWRIHQRAEMEEQTTKTL